MITDLPFLAADCISGRDSIIQAVIGSDLESQKVNGMEAKAFIGVQNSPKNSFFRLTLHPKHSLKYLNRMGLKLKASQTFIETEYWKRCLFNEQQMAAWSVSAGSSAPR
jgi:hypothetical protein